jgi:peptidoglycan/xylan/chitin deacetylase (PgdA/CDA1 family)
VALLALGVAGALAGCDGAPAAAPPVTKPFFHRAGTRQIALTVDDGYNAATLAAYVQLAEDTDIRLTFSAVGSVRRNWDPLADRLRSLLARGSVQIVNHTFSHRSLQTMSDADIRADLARNDRWIADAFGVSARPYFRPPLGAVDARVQRAAAEVGYTRTLLWQSSFDDSVLLTPTQLLSAAETALHPGAVVLAHANFPTVTHLYPQILQLIKSRNLTPLTVAELFQG